LFKSIGEEAKMKKLFYVLLAWLAAINMAFAAIDINSASEAELDKLPGVGPAKAKAIIEDRQKNGPFKSADDLKRVKGIGDKTFDKLKSEITVGGSSAGKAAAKPAAAPAAAAGPATAKPAAASVETKKDSKAEVKKDAKSDTKKDAKAEDKKKDQKADKKTKDKEAKPKDDKKADKNAKDAKAEDSGKK
jgi:competence protein ComEA